MGQYKKLSYNFVIVIICVCTFFTGYSKGCSFVFADDTTDSWLQVTTNQQLVEAFKYYCKSRDVTIEGSFADGVTSFTSKTFNGIVNSLGIDVNTLQANLKYQTDGNIGTRFLFNTFSIDAYNRIFAQFLQDNDLAVGDSANENDNKVYDGYTYNGYIVYIVKNTSSQNYTFSNIVSSGAFIDDIKSDMQAVLNTYSNGWDSGGTKNWNYTYPNGVSETFIVGIGGTEQYVSDNTKLFKNVKKALFFNSSGGIVLGKEGVSNTHTVFYMKENVNNKLYIGTYFTSSVVSGYYSQYAKEVNISNPDVTPTIVYITTNNTTINNNNYEGDTIINNDGTTSDDGGGSTPPDIDPENPILPDPDYTPAEDWDIDLPDLQIPNWILSGKENKFPFDIPFNVMYALTLLQAEPEAPHLEGTLDFGFTTWDYDLDLSEFDSVALICRNMEFLAFLTGLMLMTRRLIWG